MGAMGVIGVDHPHRPHGVGTYGVLYKMNVFLVLINETNLVFVKRHINKSSQEPPAMSTLA